VRGIYLKVFALKIFEEFWCDRRNIIRMHWNSH